MDESKTETSCKISVKGRKLWRGTQALLVTEEREVGEFDFLWLHCRSCTLHYHLAVAAALNFTTWLKRVIPNARKEIS